jgi:hypothetical protein
MAANPNFRAPELKLETEKKSSETIVRATGRIILQTSAMLEKTLRDLMTEGKGIVFVSADLKGSQFSR